MPVLDVTLHWDGRPLPAGHAARLALELGTAALHVAIDAPWFGDRLPEAPPGSVERLWEHEVAELFLADSAVTYLELEFGPGGHYLALQLDGVRQVRRSGLPIDYRVVARTPGRDGAPGRYQAEARVPRDYLPAQVCRANAYLIHGSGAARCHHAHAAVPGPVPDFHQPQRFVPIAFDAG
jgi:hypothetical protein